MRAVAKTLHQLEQQLRSIATSMGVAAVGFCDTSPLDEAQQRIESAKARGLHSSMNFTFRNPQRSSDPKTALPSARSAVVVAVSYSPAVQTPSGDPSVAAVARYSAQDAYGHLAEVLDELAAELTSAGWRGTKISDSNALVDRAMAYRAGLGWLGKNTNLLVPGVGSWVVLGSVLTDLDLMAAAGGTPPELVPDGCGGCSRCISGCPTGAFVEPGVMDASKCLSWLLQAEGSFPVEYREALGNRIYGCDECQEVCPENRRAPESEQLLGTGVGDWISVDWLLESPDEELMERVGSWYIANRDPRYVRRNALVVLGNSKRSDQRAFDHITRYLECGDPMLIEHAQWSADQLGFVE